MLWSTKLKNALENDQMIPYFQPIVDNKSGEKNKFEVLVRMVDEDGKVYRITSYNVCYTKLLRTGCHKKHVQSGRTF